MAFSEETRILQWNCRGIRGKFPYLQAALQDIDVLCIQETLLWPQNNFWIKNYNIIREDIVSPNKRGICILIKNNISFDTIDLSFFSHPSVELQGISQ